MVVQIPCMARPLRYEAAAAVYHVMARGDGGKNVFEEDKDRFAWTELLEKAHGRFGWRVHAWVLMGNHFHLLLETVRRFRDDPKTARKLKALVRKLGL